MFTTLHPSPVGPLTILVTPSGSVREILFGEREHAEAREDARRCAHVVRQLDEYFAATRRDFDLELDPVGTPFQLAVWRELLSVAWGTTATYSRIAERIGRPKAVRAVGAANGANPIPIVIPCHRIVGANGSLTGYGGGLHVKRFLLALENPERPLF